jgi:hypothetical protein
LKQQRNTKDNNNCEIVSNRTGDQYTVKELNETYLDNKPSGILFHNETSPGLEDQADAVQELAKNVILSFDLFDPHFLL